MILKTISAYFVLLLAIISCKPQLKTWKFEKEIQIENVKPIGIAIWKDKIWLSDGDGNRLVQIDENGLVQQEIKGLERPMHIDSFEDKLFVPEYGKDIISVYSNTDHSLDRYSLKACPKLDAPAGISKQKDQFAIADFYNNVIHFYNGEKWCKIGEKGSEVGLLNYPTDVQLVGDLIYVADAYNHRVQVFNKHGDFVKLLAESLNINAATGIYIDEEVYVTDFENSRVLIVSNENKVLGELKEYLSKPTDLLMYNQKLYVANYKSGSVSVFEKK